MAFPKVGGWQARHSNRVLDVSVGSTDNGTPIVQWDWTGGNNQRWQIIIPNEPGGAVRFD